MPRALFTNAARTTLSAGINTVAVSATVVDGSVFPSPTGGDYAYLTIEEGAATEIVQLTARSGNTLTIVRGRDGTTGTTFTSAATVSLRLPKIVLDEIWTGIDSKLNSSAVSAYGLTLVDDANAAAARTTLGLGTAAVVNTGTSGATIPLLNGTNTWANTQSFPSTSLDAAAGTARWTFHRTSGSIRWLAGTNGNTESGSNVGSDYAIYRYNDAGTYLGNAMTIYRQNGIAAFEAVPTFAGNAALDAGDLGTSGATIPLLSTQNTWTTHQVFNANPYIDKPAGNSREVIFSSTGLLRWSHGANATAESGSNAGSDYVVARFNDAGSYVDIPIFISRATGITTFSATPYVGADAVWHAGNDGAGSGLNADLLDGYNVGTSGAAIPLLNGVNTWSGYSTFTGGVLSSTVSIGADADILLYEATGNSLGVRAGPSGSYKYFQFNGGGAFYVPDGSLSAPGYSFGSDTNTGIYRIGADNIAIVAGATAGFNISPSRVRSEIVHQFADGTAAAPSITFTNDSDSGFYRQGANILGVALGGVEYLRVRGSTAPAVEMIGRLNLTTALGTTRTSLDWGYTQSGLTISNEDNTPIYFRTSATNRVSISATGYLCVGNALGVGPLDVIHNSGDRRTLFRDGYIDTVNAANSVWSQFDARANEYYFRNSAATVLLGVDGNGTVTNLGGIWNLSTADVNALGGTGYRSGFMTMSPSTTGAPTTDWQNSIKSMGHAWNHPNEYSYELSHPFFADNLYVRRTANGFTQAWRKILTNSNAQAANGSAAAPTFSFESDTNTGMYSAGADALAFSTGGVLRLAITAAGEIDLGTSTVQTDSRLRMRKNGNNIEWGHTNTAGYQCALGAEVSSGAPFIVFNGEAGTTSNTYRTRGRLGSGIRSDNNGGMAFFTLTNSDADNQAPTARLTLAASGQATFTGLVVGRNTVGTNVNANNDTGSLSVRSDSSNAASISFHRTSAFAINMGVGTDNVFRIGGWSASNDCFQMSATGDLTMLGNVTAYSDARLKTDVETLDPHKVFEMRGVSFMKDGKKGSGVIAQEMQEVAPELVNDELEYLSVAYGNTVGYLIEGMKYLKAELEAANARIAALEAD